MSLDLKKVSAIEFDGIDFNDHPDYCDAYIVYAEYDGREMTDEELDEVNDDREFVQEKLFNYLH